MLKNDKTDEAIAANQVEIGHQYALDVVDGTELACIPVIQSAQRYLDDLERADEGWDYYFDPAPAQFFLDFVSMACHHVEGSLSGTKLVLSPYQVFYFMNIFGWLRTAEPDRRRFTETILFQGRKQGKTTIVAALSLFGLLFSDEGDKIFSISGKREQASICHRIAQAMILKMDKSIASRYKVITSGIYVSDRFTEYKALSRDTGKTGDGLRTGMLICDESSIIPTEMVNVMKSSMGSTRNPLTVHITTANYITDTYFHELYMYSKSMLMGESAMKETLFPMIYELDNAAEWDNVAMMKKSLPNLGVSVYRDFIDEALVEAINIPSSKPEYLTKYCNIWSSNAEAWLPVEEWSKNCIPEIDTTGELWVGCDLGATSDLTALTFLYRHGDKYHMDYQCFAPESVMETVPNHIKGIYGKAIASGKLSLTSGNATDYDVVKQFLLDYTADKNLLECSYDPWSAQLFATGLLEAGCPMVEVSQSMKNLSPAAKDLEVHILKGEILHLDDEFLEWQFKNTVKYTDINDNIKIRKGADGKLKIDAIIALILAVSRASSNGGLRKSKSGGVYFIKF